MGQCKTKGFAIIFVLLLLAISNEVSAQTGGYNDPCTPTESQDDGCDLENRGFRCHPELQICRCFNQTIMSYDETRDMCLVHTGESCWAAGSWWGFAGLKCQAIHATCEHTDEGPFTWRCLCNEASVPSEDDTLCLPAQVDLQCNATALPCHETTGLVCNWGRCQCPHPLSQSFNWNLKKCLGIPEAENSCGGDQGGPGLHIECGENSYCGEDRKCHCDSGWSPDFGYPSKCKLNYGEVCEIIEDSEEVDECNHDKGFRCMDGLCGCYNAPDTEFDLEQGICGVKEGYVCGALSISGNYLSCLTGLNCVPYADNPYFGICQNQTVNIQD